MTTYEIIMPKNENQGYGLKVTKLYEDISPNYDTVKNIADTCNRCGVEIEYFPDVLENYLTNFTF